MNKKIQVLDENPLKKHTGQWIFDITSRIEFEPRNNVWFITNLFNLEADLIEANINSKYKISFNNCFGVKGSWLLNWKISCLDQYHWKKILILNEKVEI